MGYFDHARNVKKYIAMMEGFDNTFMLDAVFNSLKPGKTMLELGIGPGHDLSILKKTYDIVGSDFSQAFLDEYKKTDSQTPLLILDAETLDTHLTFDYIYSNKVLIHLTKTALQASFKRQAAILNKDGLVLHSFWKGQNAKKHHGLLFTYHMPSDIVDIADEWFEPVRDVPYTEIEQDDSFYIVMRKK